MSCLSSGKPLLALSKLLHLSSFIDKEGTMRAQGRIDRADLPYDARHPFILPWKHPLTDMIIDETHRMLHHGSVELTLCQLAAILDPKVQTGDQESNIQVLLLRKVAR
ncbi:hypothetical protein M514_07769 [Trichuris suis]|uniref:Uncharacterized protein n=1 Tax=Trichuris suis TaxID=68888 RepID=A0A085MRR4_9BILA|nr:hypothetical protein M513_07769 [Trichuris suis]KFD59910.1 hypothetical protein M514_07769 [Trichuris suis]